MELPTARNDCARIKQEWPTYLVRDFGVSPEGFLTGNGGMFTKEITPHKTFKWEEPKQKATNDDTDKA